MVLAKSKNAVGLGNSLMNDRFGKGKGTDRKKVSAGIHRTGPGGETYVTNAPKEASWVKMRSVTEQAALDEFLSTAELAGTDFTAEKTNNVKIIRTDSRNPYLLSAIDERAAIRKQRAHLNRLTVPRRPPWDETTTPPELDAREKKSLLEWRRGLAELQEHEDLLMTPFERNLEVWRQLWRVIERSDLVVQIVDARNPLLFRCEDLERYVQEVDAQKNNLLLVNKADLLTASQRKAWADYFEQEGINYKFFSASLAKELNEANGLEDTLSDEGDDQPEELADDNELSRGLETAERKSSVDKRPPPTDSVLHNTIDEESQEDQRTLILSVDELEALFLANSPDIENDDAENPRKTQIGLVGYPNVGKSSTINALIGAKKVSVSSTPGKTKHFQTIHLSSQVILCDCPGLVFPNFATTKAELVCNGILPIDQLREFTGPAGLVAQRIPLAFYEGIYGVRVHMRPLEEGGTGVPTAEEILVAYAAARGFAKTGQGQPDESRAARYILKDYVRGKLLFCHPPPHDPPIDDRAFNRELYDLRHSAGKRESGPAVDDDESFSDLENSLSVSDMDEVTAAPVQGAKSKKLDRDFFGGQSNAGHSTMSSNHRHENGEPGQTHGKQLSGRKQRVMIALEKKVDPADVRLGNGKKHFKGNRRNAKSTPKDQL